MFPSLWSVGGPVWLSSDDLLIAIQYVFLEKEPLSHLVIGKEVVTWSHCKSWHVIQLGIHLSVFELQNVMTECDHPGILNSLLSNQMLSVFLILRVSFSFCGNTFVFDVFIVALSCNHLHYWCIQNHSPNSLCSRSAISLGGLIADQSFGNRWALPYMCLSIVVDTMATKAILTNRIMGHSVFHNTYKSFLGAFLVPTSCQFIIPGTAGTDKIFYTNTLMTCQSSIKKNLYAQLFSELWLAFHAHKAAMD